MSSLVPGARCRATRTILYPGGIVRRASAGTLVSQRQNCGRELFTVDFDSGQKLILFAHEIEPEDGAERHRRLRDHTISPDAARTPAVSPLTASPP